MSDKIIIECAITNMIGCVIKIYWVPNACAIKK